MSPQADPKDYLKTVQPIAPLNPAEVVKTPISQPSVFDQAVQSYPIIGKSGVQGVINPKEGQNMLEYYAPGEAGSADAPRPKGLQLDKPGIEIYSNKTTPLDVLGDVTSHYLIHNDPVVKNVYSNLAASITPHQMEILKGQYDYAMKNEGEKRPFEQWLQMSGLPAFLRGYAFKQWPDEFNEKVYTPQQKQMLDGMMKYLSGGQK